MRRNKRGSLELSVSTIVTLILALTMLSIGLVFVKGMLGKMFNKFEEQIAKEPEPPKPSMSEPLTLSRNPMKAMEDTTEVLKISMLNPTSNPWQNRRYIRTEGMCGKVDGICFIDVDDTTETCDEDNYKENDPDCKLPFLTDMVTGMDCGNNSKKSPCLISNIYENDEDGGGDMYCPRIPGQRSDPNCDPREGVDIYLNCDKRLMEKPFYRNIGSIQNGDHKTNMLLLRIEPEVNEDQYLCQIEVFAEDKEYTEDMVVKIKNE